MLTLIFFKMTQNAMDYVMVTKIMLTRSLMTITRKQRRKNELLFDADRTTCYPHKLPRESAPIVACLSFQILETGDVLKRLEQVLLDKGDDVLQTHVPQQNLPSSCVVGWRETRKDEYFIRERFDYARANGCTSGPHPSAWTLVLQMCKASILGLILTLDETSWVVFLCMSNVWW